MEVLVSESKPWGTASILTGETGMELVVYRKDGSSDRVSVQNPDIARSMMGDISAEGVLRHPCSHPDCSVLVPVSVSAQCNTHRGRAPKSTITSPEVTTPKVEEVI